VKVLAYENRKSPLTLYDISTPEKEAAAYLRLFKELDGYWQCYADLEEVEEPTPCEPCEAKLHKHCTGSCSCVETEECKRTNREYRPLYLKAKAGDVAAIKKLMNSRKTYEYENVWETELVDPLIPEEEEVEA
jgi:hypothetical protein